MIAITTPTGTIGSKVLRNLVEAGTAPIRVLARNPAKLPDSLTGKIEVLEGSMEDAFALRQLLEGATALFWCQPDAATANDYLGAYASLARFGAGAMQSSGVSRVVAISAIGEPGDTPAGPITALHHMEAILAKTDAHIRFLQCGSFFENLLWQWDRILEEGIVSDPCPPSVVGPHVAAADIARVAANLLSERDWSGRKRIPLIGPEDLTFDAIAAHLSDALNRKVRYVQATPDQYIAAMETIGQSQAAAQAIVEMYSFLASAYQPPENANRSLTPTTLAQWLQR